MTDKTMMNTEHFTILSHLLVRVQSNVGGISPQNLIDWFTNMYTGLTKVVLDNLIAFPRFAWHSNNLDSKYRIYLSVAR